MPLNDQTPLRSTPCTRPPLTSTTPCVTTTSSSGADLPMIQATYPGVGPTGVPLAGPHHPTPHMTPSRHLPSTNRSLRKIPPMSCCFSAVPPLFAPSLGGTVPG